MTEPSRSLACLSTRVTGGVIVRDRLREQASGQRYSCATSRFAMLIPLRVLPKKIGSAEMIILDTHVWYGGACDERLLLLKSRLSAPMKQM